MQALNRKLVRDVIHLRGQLLAVMAVVMCGVAIYVTMRGVYDSLSMARDDYYDSYGFADVFTSLREAPNYVDRQIAVLPGVGDFTTRIVNDVTLDVRGLSGVATGRLVTLPEHGLPSVNAIFLREGRFPDSTRLEEVIASEAFMQANALKLGDSIVALINGRRQGVRIVGKGLSPEYVYEVSGRASIFPDNKYFGVFWISRKAMEHAFDMTGSFNDVAVRLAPGAKEADVIHELDQVLVPYGGVGAFGRDEHISARLIHDKIDQLRAMSTMIPVIFLGVAAFLLHIILSRLIATQRTEIAVLKAFGYTNTRVALHYLEFALVAVFFGSILGALAGLQFGKLMMVVYQKFYRFPALPFHAGLNLILNSAAITAVAACTGALTSVRAAVKLPPAEAMRPEAPAFFHAGPLERIGLHKLFSTSGRMALRDIERRPIKAGMTVLTIALAIAILMVGRFSLDGVTALVSIGFYSSQLQDLSASFLTPRPPSVKYDLARLPGVTRVECTRSIPVKIAFSSRSRRTVLIAMERGSQLRRLADRFNIVHELPRTGISVTAKIAQILGAHLGDTLTLTTLFGERREVRQVLSDTVDEVIGFSAYMDIRNLGDITHEDLCYSEALLSVDASRIDALQAQMKEMPQIAGVEMRTSAIDEYETLEAQSENVASFVLVFFATVLAFGVVYNSGRIALSERGRELASLRVLGFTKGEAAWVLLLEQIIIIGVGIPTGFGLGWLLCMSIRPAYDTEMYRLPFIISSYSLGFSATVILVSGLISALLISRRTFSLDLIEVLKTRE